MVNLKLRIGCSDDVPIMGRRGGRGHYIHQSIESNADDVLTGQIIKELAKV